MKTKLIQLSLQSWPVICFLSRPPKSNCPSHCQSIEANGRNDAFLAGCSEQQSHLPAGCLKRWSIFELVVCKGGVHFSTGCLEQIYIPASCIQQGYFPLRVYFLINASLQTSQENRGMVSQFHSLSQPIVLHRHLGQHSGGQPQLTTYYDEQNVNLYMWQWKHKQNIITQQNKQGDGEKSRICFPPDFFIFGFRFFSFNDMNFVLSLKQDGKAHTPGRGEGVGGGGWRRWLGELQDAWRGGGWQNKKKKTCPNLESADLMRMDINYHNFCYSSLWG